MNAVVMEKNNSTCAVLCDDGSFRRISGDFRIGEKIEVIADTKTSCHIKQQRKIKKKSLSKMLLPYVAAAAIILLGSGIYYETAYAYSYVTIDVNPSIELTLNRLNRVIDVTALNDDAKDIVDSLNKELRLTTISEAVSKTIEVLQENEYLLDESSSMLIDVISENDDIASELSKSISSSVSEHENITSVVLQSDKDSRQEATKSGLSTGRFEAMKNAEEEKNIDHTPSSNEAQITEYKEKSVKEIMNEMPDTSVTDDKIAPGTSTLPEFEQKTESEPFESHPSYNGQMPQNLPENEPSEQPSSSNQDIPEAPENSSPQVAEPPMVSPQNDPNIH